MSIIHIDGFDKYGPVSTGLSGSGGPNTLVPLLMQEGKYTYWDIPTYPGLVIAPGLSNFGTALQMLGEANINYSIGINYAQLIGGIRFQSDLTGASYIRFQDTSFAQCSIAINTDGTLALNRATSSSVIATTGAGVIVAGVTHYLEWNIVFGSSASYTIYLDGISVLSGTGDTIETANSYATIINILGNNCIWDDFYVVINDGLHTTAPLLTNPQIITNSPTGDQQTQMNNNGNILGYDTFIYEYQGSFPNDQLTLMEVIAPVNCSISSLSFKPNTSYPSGNYVPVLYGQSGLFPGSLLATGYPALGAVANVNLHLVFSSPYSLIAGTNYYIGVLTDTTTTGYCYSSGAIGLTAVNSFTSGAPSSAPSMSIGQAIPALCGICSGASTNWESLNTYPTNDQFNSVIGTSAGVGDYYTFPPLPIEVNKIYCVASRSHLSVLNGGSKTVENRILSSGGTYFYNTPDITVSGSDPSWKSLWAEADPATGTVWTSTGVGNAYCGITIIS